MLAATHRIRRQTWRVHTRSPPDAFAARQRLRGELADDLLAALGRACDEVAPGETVVHIPRLELALRIGGVERLGELAELLRQQLVERLREAVDAARVPAPLRLTGAQQRQALLRGYLASGQLAWPWRSLDDLVVGAGPVPEDAPLRQLEQALAEGLDTALALAPPGTALDEARVAFYFRLLELAAEPSWPEVARAAAAAAPFVAEEAAAALAALATATASSSPGPGGPLHRYARLLLGATVLALIGLPAAAAEARALALFVRRALVVTAGAPLAALLDGLPPALTAFLVRRLHDGAALAGDPLLDGASGPAAEPPRRQDAGGAAPASPDQNQPPPAPPAPGRPAGALIPAALAGTGAVPPPAARAGSRAAPPSGPAAPPPGGTQILPRDKLLPGQVVSHAGLVLLHPFVPRLFEITRLVAPAARALEPELLPRAAALLHFLATGGTAASELELGLIKPLLGVPPGHPLPIADGLLDAGDREEASSLLSAAITHWTALGRISIEGLRGTFLQRCGLLREDDGGFHLQVKPAAFDLLLMRLPWGFGTFKWPWMTKPLFTEWTAQ